MMANGKMDRPLVKVDSSILMATSMMANGQITRLMGSDLI